MSKNEYIRRPGGMLKHVVMLRGFGVPADQVEAVRIRFMAGMGRMDIARELRLSYNAVCNTITAEAGKWREEERLARLVEDERRIIVTRTVVFGSELRRVRHSLPRVSMHVAALEGRP